MTPERLVRCPKCGIARVTASSSVLCATCRPEAPAPVEEHDAAVEEVFGTISRNLLATRRPNRQWPGDICSCGCLVVAGEPCPACVSTHLQAPRGTASGPRSITREVA